MTPRPAVVDTMLFAYALLGVTPRRDIAIAVLENAQPLWVPDSLRAELANVVWQWVRQRGVPLAVGHAALDRADALVDEYISAGDLWHDALTLALETGHPVYDTLFVALARRRETVVVSDDVKLLAAFPRWVVAPEGFLRP